LKKYAKNETRRWKPNKRGRIEGRKIGTCLGEKAPESGAKKKRTGGGKRKPWVKDKKSMQ